MEQARKNLKIISGLILLLTGLTLLQTIAAMVFSIDISMLPVGASEDLLLTAKIVIVVVSLLLLAPQVYVGVRGLQLVKNPAPAKAPVVWATILLVFFVLSLISPLIALFQQNEVGQNISTLLSVLVDILIYIDYIRCVKALQKAE